MERHFDEELRFLKEKLLRMSSLAETAIGESVKALVNRNSALVEKVATGDEPINMMEIEIDELCLKLLALHQPQAGDLRFIAAAMKINNDLERIGDLAVNIAKTTRHLMKISFEGPLTDISKMAEIAQGMLGDSLSAFINNDASLAMNVCTRDDEVDQLKRKVLLDFMHSASKDQKAKEWGIELVLISRNLERIADHSTNICEDVIYMVEGKTIKHHIQERKQNS